MSLSDARTSCAHDISDFSFITCHSGQLEMEGELHYCADLVYSSSQKKASSSKVESVKVNFFSILASWPIFSL